MINDNNTVKSNGVDKINPPMPRLRRAGRKLVGQIISAKMTNTVIVKVESVKVHPKYHKRYKVSKKYPSHVDTNEFRVGDKVTIEESRPYSKTVNWKVINKA